MYAIYWHTGVWHQELACGIEERDEILADLEDEGIEDVVVSRLIA